MIKDKILSLLKDASKKVGVDMEGASLQHPVNTQHGDFSSNIAFISSKQLGKNPMELAQLIADSISQDDSISRVEAVKPGFVNFFLSDKALVEILTQKDTSKKNGKKILLEYGQPNTHKTPHIGHLFSYTFGESLARILEHEGNKVIRANYQGDVGLHVAKCLYVVKEKISEFRGKELKEKIDFLQQCYQQGSALYEQDEKLQKTIDQLNQLIYNRDAETMKLWKETRAWCLEYFKQFEDSLGIKYDKYFFESEIADDGKKIVKENVEKFFEESEGAIIFKGEKYGLHTRVFITKYDMPTYEAKDIGLNNAKRKLDFDLSIVTTASEQNEYYKVISKVSELLFPELKNKLKHLGFGLIQLKTGKMSSRTGEIIDAFGLVELTQQTIAKEYKAEENLALKIALAAIKYSFLHSDAYKNIVFDLEKSIAREGDSGPYLLYTYVRTQSILAKSSTVEAPSTIKLNPEEKNLLSLLYRFPEVVEQAALRYSPHLLATYLFQLAQAFNFFYQKHQVLKADEVTKQLRLSLTQHVGKTIKEGLRLLGIETVEKM